MPQPEPFSDFLEAYGAHSWVYSCVKAIADAFSSIEILPYIKRDESWEVDTKHPLYNLLSSPNPYMSGYNLREYTASALKLTGNAYWYAEKFGTKDPKELWPLLPDKVLPVATKNKLIDHYVYQVGQNYQKLDISEVIHFRSLNPGSMIYGQGALKAAKTTVTTDIFAQIWNKSFFKNSARPDVGLETDQTLKDDVRKRVIKSWEQAYRGVDKKGKTAILEAGLKLKDFGSSVKDMDFVNLRKELRVEILSAFGVPPAVAGLLEFANYSNMKEQTKTFWMNTIIPMVRNVEQTLTSRAKQITFRPGVEFQGDLSTVEALRPDEQMRSGTAKTYVDMGIPLNAVIDALDLPFEHVEGGDEPRQPANPFTLESEKPETKALDYTKEEVRFSEWKQFDNVLRTRESKFQTAMRGFFRVQAKRVLKRLEENSAVLLNDEGPGTSVISRLFKKALGGHSGRAYSEKAVRDTMEIIFDLKAEDEALARTSERLIRGTYFDFAVRTARKIDPNFDFDLKDPVAQSWIDAKKFKLVREANSHTLEELTEETVEAVEEAVRAGFSRADTIAEIKNRVNDVYDFAVTTRAERIARTEVISAANAGNQDAMEKTGVEKKQWLSSRDANVRETHQSLDAQETTIGEPFISPSGASLKFPGDPEAPAGEVINCRCTTIPIVGE